MDNFANQPNINPNFAASTHTKMPDTNSVCGPKPKFVSGADRT